MIKVKASFIILLSTSFLLGCSTPKKEPVEEKEASKDLIISEINTGTYVNNRAVEIANIGEEDINLEGYTLDVYRSYSTQSTESISLVGEIKSHSTFILAFSGASSEIKSKAQQLSDNYLNDGTFPVSLNYQGKVLDAVGKIGYNYDFAKKAVLVRKPDYFTQNQDFELYHWIRYPINTIDTLGNYECPNDETLLEGPRLTEENFSTPFCKEADEGTGGVVEVSLVWTSDGDTTGFNYGSKYSIYDISGSLSTRYYGINTPEIAHSAGEVADPYGNEARDFTNAILRRSKRFLIQSVAGYSLHETYGRMLGYVWVSEKENPEIEDYQLLNYLIIKEGFSRPAFLTRDASYNSLMTYQGISYVEYLYNADNYAEVHHLNLHSGE